MGKISSEELQKLVDEGKISVELAEEWKKQGIVAISKRETARYLKSKNGTLVRPELVFGGLNGDEYSSEMEKFKLEFQKLVKKYCKTEDEYKEK